MSSRSSSLAVLLLALVAFASLASLPASAQSCGTATSLPCRDGKKCCVNTYGGGSSCVNPLRADDHCGDCGYQCDPEQHDADLGRRCCGTRLVDGSPFPNCVDTQTDTTNCGGCSKTCATIANGQPVCTKGVCGVKCNAGFVLSNGVCAPVCTGTPFSSCGDNPSCFCFTSTENNKLCFANDFCVNLAPCGTSADCPTGRSCVVGTGCVVGVCAAPCTTSSAPLARRRGGGATLVPAGSE